MFDLIMKYGLTRYFKYSSYYRKKMSGNVVDHCIKYADGYFPEDINSTMNLTMKSGKTAVYKIISLNGVDDFGSANIKLDLIQYKGVKPIRECSLPEFMEFYYTLIKI